MNFPMELQFKKAIKAAFSQDKPSHFGQLLTKNTSWSFLEERGREPLPVKELTEKSLVLDALEDFSKEKIEENKGEPLKFKGGEIRLKKEGARKSLLEASEVFSDLSSEMISLLGEELFLARFGEKRNLFEDSSTLKVIFVTEEIFVGPEGAESKEQKELQSFLDIGASKLFEKMIQAMQLSYSEYILGALHFRDASLEKHSYLDYLIQEIILFKPKLIITLGAKPANALLGMNDRLMNLHGNLYPVAFKASEESFKCQLMPLFHPELLSVASEMKRSAWIDMQKAMRFLKEE